MKHQLALNKCTVLQNQVINPLFTCQHAFCKVLVSETQVADSFFHIQFAFGQVPLLEKQVADSFFSVQFALSKCYFLKSKLQFRFSISTCFSKTFLPQTQIFQTLISQLTTCFFLLYNNYIFFKLRWQIIWIKRYIATAVFPAVH